MNDEENQQEMTYEDRLKSIAYQFIALYERWSEDRQVAAKQGADIAELVTIFTEQVKGFKQLEANVRQQLINSIQHAASSAAKAVSEEIQKEANRAIENTARDLAKSVELAQYTLKSYQTEVITTQWKVIGLSAITTIVTSLLAVWLLIPAPTLPLTSQQIKNMESGQMMDIVWPKLSKKEQDHWFQLAQSEKQPNIRKKSVYSIYNV